VSSATMNQSVCEYLVWPCDPKNDSRVDPDILGMVPLLISGSTPSTHQRRLSSVCSLTRTAVLTTDIMAPQFLSGDKSAIDGFLDRFDVRAQKGLFLCIVLTGRYRSSCSTAMVCAHLFSMRHVGCTRNQSSTRIPYDHLLIVTKDRRPLVRRSPIRKSPRDTGDAEE
jgi:hypothetical protein